jgi:hypothetical protein
LYPDRNWGVFPNGRNLTGASKLSFWAKGANGGEIAEFKVGGVSGQKPGQYTESLPLQTLNETLTKDWKPLSIDLTGMNLSNLFSGFCWTTNDTENPNGCTIYVKDIRFE